MKKKVLFGTIVCMFMGLFVSCGDLMGMLYEPDLRNSFYEYEPYINGALIKINNDKVKNADTLVLYYNDEEVMEFNGDIFIPSQPQSIYTSIEGYSICAKNKTGISDKEKLYINSFGYSSNKSYDVILTQKSEDYNSIKFEWKFKQGDLKYYEYEDCKLECLIGDSSYRYGLDILNGDCTENVITYKNLEPATVYSNLYGHLVYSWTDLMGNFHEREDIKLVSAGKGYEGHTKALDKIKNFSVTTKRTSAEITFTELTDEQLRGLKKCEYMVRVTNKDDLEEKPTIKCPSKDKTTGKYSISGLKPETNYQFDLFAAEYSDFAEYADMATEEGKTEKALATLEEPTITASDTYDEDLKTSFTVKFEKHSYDTTEHPMEYQVEYYLFKTTSPKTANAGYFSYPADGKVTVSGINTGNTYKVILKARDVSDPESVISTDVTKVKTKIYSDSTYSSTYASYYTSSGTTYNWGTLSGKIVANNGYSKIDISSLYEYNAPKMLVINYSTSPTVTLNYQSTKMGHFDVYFYRPDETEASPSKLKPVTMASYLNQTPEYTANLCGNFISDSYVYNDCLYITPVKQYESLYSEELSEDYKVGITFVTNSSY